MLRKLNPLQVKFSIHRKTHREIICCLLLSHSLPGTYFQIMRLFICSLYHTSRFPKTELAPISVSGWEVPYFLRKNCPQMPLKEQPIEPSQCHLDKESPCPKNQKIIFQYIKSEEKFPLIFLLFFKKKLDNCAEKCSRTS